MGALATRDVLGLLKQHKRKDDFPSGELVAGGPEQRRRGGSAEPRGAWAGPC